MHGYFLFLLLLPSYLSKIYKISNPMTKSKVRASSDNYLIDFTLNGLSVDIEGFKDLGTWQTLKQFTLSLSPGDVLSFVSMNEEESQSNPRGMVASIEYVKRSGEVVVYNTGDGWVCDGQAPVKEQKIETTTTWRPWKTHFSKEVWVIWGPLRNVKSTCTFTIPRE